MKTMLEMTRPISGVLTTIALLAAALLAVANASADTPHRRVSREAIREATTSAPHGDGNSSRAADTRSSPSCAYINDELISTRKTIEETAAAMKISVERVRTCRNDAELEGSPAFPTRHPTLSADEREIVHAFCNGVDIDAPDGPQCVIGDLCDQAITIASVYRGAFSGPGKTEALVDFDDPCKALVEGLGGYALLRLEPGGWRRILTANDRLERCIPFRGTGGARDFLACAHLELCSSGCGRSWWLSTVHVRDDSTVRSGALLSLDDNTPALDGACWTGESGDVVWSWFTSPEVRITSRGGHRSGLLVRVTMGEAPIRRLLNAMPHGNEPAGPAPYARPLSEEERRTLWDQQGRIGRACSDLQDAIMNGKKRIDGAKRAALTLQFDHTVVISCPPRQRRRRLLDGDSDRNKGDPARVERAGHTITLPANHETGFIVTVDGQGRRVHLREQLQQVKVQETYGEHTRLKPTGRLGLLIDEYLDTTRKRWADGKRARAGDGGCDRRGYETFIYSR